MFDVLPICGKNVLPYPRLESTNSSLRAKTCNYVRIFSNLAVQFEGRNLAT